MFIVLEIQTDANNTVNTLLTSHETINEAESKYHQVLSYAATSNLACHAASLLNIYGDCIKSQYYIHSISPTPEPEENT